MEKAEQHIHAIEIMLKEYETLRQESLNSMNSRNTILSFGLVAIGAIFAASVNAYSKDTYSLISSFALILVVPLINSFILLIWLGEYNRMHRAGKFLVEIEHKVNEEFSTGLDIPSVKKLLSWETFLRERRVHMRYPYNATVALMTLISFILFSVGLIVTVNISVILTYSIFIAGVLFHLGLYSFMIIKISKILN